MKSNIKFAVGERDELIKEFPKQFLTSKTSSNAMNNKGCHICFSPLCLEQLTWGSVTSDLECYYRPTNADLALTFNVGHIYVRSKGYDRPRPKQKPCLQHNTFYQTTAVNLQVCTFRAETAEENILYQVQTLETFREKQSGLLLMKM